MNPSSRIDTNTITLVYLSYSPTTSTSTNTTTHPNLLTPTTTPLPFPKKLFRRVPSCPSLTSNQIQWHNLNLKVSFPKMTIGLKLRERLSMQTSAAGAGAGSSAAVVSSSELNSSSSTMEYHHPHQSRGNGFAIVDDTRDGASPVPTLLGSYMESGSGSEGEDGVNTPRTSTSGSEVTVVGFGERDEEEGEKAPPKLSYRKILDHVPGFSDDDDDDVNQHQHQRIGAHQHEDDAHTHTHHNPPFQLPHFDFQRRHSLANTNISVKESEREVFWGLRAGQSQGQGHGETHEGHGHHNYGFGYGYGAYYTAHGGAGADDEAEGQELRTQLTPPPWHRARHAKVKVLGPVVVEE
ncbi:hypothetical protein CVT24_011807 [Panaeolus cyanescens]|uniref:Uncharacterized protein n=1 Tax=Panaeolus cyanescens TaxID=181874 RepID=A0A409VHA6_9AGAR|nr:hypothetical protein CVT24_011807 [Panaeolus cyanescens]